MAEFRIVRKMCVIGRLHEARDEAFSQLVISARFGVDEEHPRVPVGNLGVPGRSAQDFRPVVAETFDVLRMPRM